MARLQTIRQASDRRRADGWALALASQGIESALDRARGGWQLSVAEERAVEAHQVLETYEGENAPGPPEPAPPPDWGPTNAGVALALALLLFFGVTGPRDPSVSWFARGSADAATILGGEVWRSVTALTLHADLPHVVANAVSGALFATVVCRTWGPGAGGLLILLAGIAGNLANALYHGSHHSSVGASTSVFGAIGILAGTQLIRRRRRRGRRGRAWLPLAGALGLLAMLGTAERADLGAHLLGLLAGVALGAGIAAFPGTPPRAPTQLLLGGLAAGCVVAAWLVALGS